MCFLTKTSFIFVFLLYFNLICGLQYLIVVTHDNDTICYDDKEECEWSIISEAADSPADRIPLNFSFPLYQETFNRLFISPNGYIQFYPRLQNEGKISYREAGIDKGSYDMSIAGILTDLDPILYDYSNVYYYSDDERFEVLFDKVSIFKTEPDSINVNYTFSISLYPNGVVQITYHDIPKYEDAVELLPVNLNIDSSYYFYYSGIIGLNYNDNYTKSYQRDYTTHEYGIKYHKQIDLIPQNSFHSNNTILLCPMPEKLCITPYFIDVFEGGEVHMTGDIMSCENDLVFRCVLNVFMMQTMFVEAKYTNNEIICKIPPFSEFKLDITKYSYNNKTIDDEEKKKRINEPNPIYILLEYLATYESIDQSEYFYYTLNSPLKAVFIDFDDKEENYTSTACDDTDVNVCDSCGECGGKNECMICDNKTLYYTKCEDNCTSSEEFYDGECVKYDEMFDCLGEYDGSGVVSKNSAGNGIVCCLKEIDCANVCKGVAEIDDCGNCVGGTTGKTTEDFLDCDAVCNGPNKPPCFSNIVYNDSDIVIQHEITDEPFNDTIILYSAFVNGTAAVRFTRAFVYPQMPYYPKIEVYVINNGSEHLISQFYDNKAPYLLSNSTIYLKIKALTQKLNTYSPKSVNKHKITLNDRPIFSNDEYTMTFDLYITYNHCERRKGYEQCYLPGCFFCIGNGGFNVATETKMINGVCVDGNVSVCHGMINKSDDGFMFVFCNLWLFVIVIFIL